MKLNFKCFVITLLSLSTTFAYAQETKSAVEKFTPNGKAVVTVYSNFSAENTDGANNTGFEIERAYLGYDHNFSKNFSAEVVYDITNNEGQTPTAYTAFLKKAYAEYTNENLQISLGMMSTTSFKFQESLWGKRYLYKSLQDEYSFESSADLGLSVKWQALPKLGVDVSLFNGEGYKKVQADSTVKLALGLTYEPIKNFFGRVYYDYMKNDNISQTTFNLFMGYRSKQGSFGVEYDIQKNNKLVADRHYSAVSIYGTVAVAKKLSIFGRFDNLMSEKIGASTTGWNAADGQVYIVGLEIVPVRGIQITPNFRYSDLAVGSSTTSFYLNLGVNF